MWVNSEYKRLKTVLLCKPTFYRILPINLTAKKYIESGQLPNIHRAIEEHEELVRIYENFGVEVIMMEPDPDLPYQTFTRDFASMTPKGAVISRMHVSERQREPVVGADILVEHSIPIAGFITRGTCEGGDYMFLDEHTLVVGCGGRSNSEGIQYLKDMSPRLGLEIIPVMFHGDFVHMDCVGNIIGEKLIIACLDALPASYVDILKERHFTIINIPAASVPDLSANVMALDEKTILSHASNNRVNDELKALGFEVLTVNIPELLKAGGGIHCNVFPVQRT
ncbi:MAG: hypothetical protein KG012_11780 [Deltaproteobacteria bacterium]|nr:hypothetical protein [Deltaproteobacteria bacterium]